MAYTYMSLTPKRSTLGRVRSTAYPGGSYLPPIPRDVPDYTQQISQFMSQNPAPQFQTGTPHEFATTPFSFTHQGNPAFQPLQTPRFDAAPGPGGASIDYSQDPILQQVQAQIQAQIQQAEAASLAAEKQSLIRYGDPTLVDKVLGKGADKATREAAAGNTFGTVQELGRWNTRALGGVDSATNRANLFFSSTRARDRGLQQEDYQRQQARTANQLQDVLTSIAQGLLASKQAAQGQLMSAMEAAYMRALAAAQAGYYGTGAPSSGTPTLNPGYLEWLKPAPGTTTLNPGYVDWLHPR